MKKLYTLILLSTLAFAAVVVFHLVTLPVELDASKRALIALDQEGILAEGEQVGARKVLGAAAMTYLAALFMTVLQFLRILLIRGRNDG